MRIIAGEFRGRRLLDPADRSTRPITDRVKQSLFDVLSHRIDGAGVFDVFAGTGSFGLESLSRGAHRVTFFERHRPAVQRLRQNIQTLGMADRCQIITQDVFRWASSMPLPAKQPDVVFFDPPYPFLEQRREELVTLLTVMGDHMAADGLIVFRTPITSSFPTPLRIRDERSWGSMRVQFLGTSAGD